MSTTPAAPFGNRLLARLAPADLAPLERHLRAVPLELEQVLYQVDGPIDYVYFPLRGVVSTVTILSDGKAIEVANIGNEGVVGGLAFLGEMTSPNRVFVQVEGDALRVETRFLQHLTAAEGPLRRLLMLYNRAYLSQVSYSVACNGLHKVEQRCCRWLLMTHDRVGTDVLPLTHEFLGIMLGVRRSSVTEVLNPLRERGLLSYARGKITVLDRKGLEAVCCECYRAVEAEYERVFSVLRNANGGPQR